MVLKYLSRFMDTGPIARSKVLKFMNGAKKEEE
jgi:hypothetical protein